MLDPIINTTNASNDTNTTCIYKDKDIHGYIIFDMAIPLVNLTLDLPGLVDGDKEVVEELEAVVEELDFGVIR